MTYDQQIEILNWAKSGERLEYREITYRGTCNLWKPSKHLIFDFVNNEYRKEVRPREFLLCRLDDNILTECDCEDPCNDVIKVREILNSDTDWQDIDTYALGVDPQEVLIKLEKGEIGIGSFCVITQTWVGSFLNNKNSDYENIGFLKPVSWKAIE